MTSALTDITGLQNNKIDKSAIANNLTTTDSGYVLDARQGKILNDKFTSSARYDAHITYGAIGSYVRYSYIGKMVTIVCSFILPGSMAHGTVLANGFPTADSTSPILGFDNNTTNRTHAFYMNGYGELRIYGATSYSGNCTWMVVGSYLTA